MLTVTPAAEPTRRAVLSAAASQPVSAASTAALRVGFGLIVAYSSLRFLLNGWVDRLYLEPEHHLTYRWFGWVEPLPPLPMHGLVAALAVLGVCVAVGYRTKLATSLFVVGFAYSELIDAALYLNHYWFVTLVGLLMLLLPVQHFWSLDAAQGRTQSSASVPIGVVWILRAQLAVVYLFAGIAKLNTDWLLRAQPMDLWLSDRVSTPVLGPLLGVDGVAHVMSWAGAVFDCTVVGWLLWRRSRPLAYLTLVVFHATTGLLFQIGVFPLVMIVAALVFFDPDWPLSLGQRLRRSGPRDVREAAAAPAPRIGISRLALLALFASTQLWLPLRHYGEPSNVRWSEEGYHLSWRVMLTEKAGFVDFEVVDPATGERWSVDPSLVLEDWQRSVAATRPDLIHASAHLIAQHYAAAGLEVEVRAEAWVAMNGRPAARIIDPTIDLAAHERGRVPVGWILPAGG